MAVYGALGLSLGLVAGPLMGNSTEQHAFVRRGPPVIIALHTAGSHTGKVTPDCAGLDGAIDRGLASTGVAGVQRAETCSKKRRDHRQVSKANTSMQVCHEKWVMRSNEGKAGYQCSGGVTARHGWWA